MCFDRLTLIAWPFFILTSAYINSGCHSEKKNHTYIEVPDSNISKGRELATVYCQSCHALPDPSLADAKSWFNGILPQMAPRLGIFSHNFQSYPSRRFDKNLPKDFYPSKPLITSVNWQYIIDYYCATSPDSLYGSERPESIEKNLPFFKVLKPQGEFIMPATVFVKIGQGIPGASFMIADALKNTITCYDSHLQVKDTFKLEGPTVDQVQVDSFKWIVCDIGVLVPNDGKNGKLISIKLSHQGKMESSNMIFDSLRRPVQLLEADLNKDGRKDLLVCEFGNLLGSLSWLEQIQSGVYKRHVLKAVPGAIKVIINDYNHDGLPDIWCLFAQGNESIWLFTNLGSGKFNEREVLQFPPIYGSSYFELDDFNKDGYPDILYTCGDNADYSTVLKPYHGVYIFLNNGSNHFSQKYFFPMNGSYKAMARDFDADGDLDIASISFFPDFDRRPEESFVYLENQGNFSFKPYSFPEAIEGRWLTMDAGDMDGDGKEDIILGNMSIAPSFITKHHDWKKQAPYLILKNQFR